MSVQVSGQTSVCGPKKCLNRPIRLWDFIQAFAGGTLKNIPRGGVQIAASPTPFGVVAIVDTSTNVRLSKNFCFTARIQKASGIQGAVGLVNGDIISGDNIRIDIAATTSLIWKKSGIETTFNLGIVPDAGIHTYRLCRVGNVITVKIDDLPVQTFPIDDNFPGGFAHPVVAAAIDAVVNIFSFCVAIQCFNRVISISRISVLSPAMYSRMQSILANMFPQ